MLLSTTMSSTPFAPGFYSHYYGYTSMGSSYFHVIGLLILVFTFMTMSSDQLHAIDFKRKDASSPERELLQLIKWISLFLLGGILFCFLPANKEDLFYLLPDLVRKYTNMDKTPSLACLYLPLITCIVVCWHYMGLLHSKNEMDATGFFAGYTNNTNDKITFSLHRAMMISLTFVLVIVLCRDTYALFQGYRQFSDASWLFYSYLNYGLTALAYLLSFIAFLCSICAFGFFIQAFNTKRSTLSVLLLSFYFLLLVILFSILFGQTIHVKNMYFEFPVLFSQIMLYLIPVITAILSFVSVIYASQFSANITKDVSATSD
jgi:hypothetical protein